MSKRKWLLPMLLSLPLAAVVLFLGGCLPVGLGDPEASKVDPKLVGAWQDDGDGVVVLLPFDGRAYLMRTVEVERTDEGVELEPGEGCYKAWLTTIEGRTFLTAQPLYLREAVEVRERRSKTYDLRPLIEMISVIAQADGTAWLKMTLAAREGATGRPEEVLSALGIEPETARVERTRLIFK